MANPLEIASIEVNGQIFKNWTSMEVINDTEGAPKVQFNFTASEVTGSTNLQNLGKIKPGDKVTVKLAGVTVVNNGWVMIRHAAIDRNNHQIQIAGYDPTGELIHNDVPLKGNQFKKSTFEQIAKKVMQPHQIQLEMKNATKDMKKEFKDVSAIPGESVFDFIDRLARMRNIHTWTDGSGTLFAGRPDSSGSSAQIVEGKNLLMGSCRISGQRYGSSELAGQNKGDDKTSDEDARKPAAKTELKPGQFVVPLDLGQGIFGARGATMPETPAGGGSFGSGVFGIRGRSRGG